MMTLALLTDGEIVTRFELNADELTVGRKPDNAIHIDDQTVSGFHALLTRTVDELGAENWKVQDLGSTNGTFVNGKQITDAQLNTHDEVRFGWTQFRLLDDNESTFEQTAYILPGQQTTEL